MVRDLLVVAWLCLPAAACGNSGGPEPSLPLQASSAHFRYHAVSAGEVLPGLLDALEANRADVFSYFGLANDEVVDYYLFADDASVAGICGVPDGCAIGRQVVTTGPIHYHELIHAYLASLGSPAHVIVEGVADAINCFLDGNRGPVVPEWQDLFRVDGDRNDDFYNTSMRLVRYLILQFGPERFIDYYKHAPSTGDATAFANHFQSYWSLSIDQAWTAANVASPALVEPICPCRAASITPSMDVEHLSHLYGSAYLPIVVDPGSALTIEATTSSSLIEVSDCERSSPALMAATSASASSPGLNLIQLDGRPWFIRSGGMATDDLRAAADSPLRTTCDAAGTLSLDATTSALTAIVPKGSAPVYVRLSVTGSPALAIARALEGSLRLCADCSRSDCRSVPPSPGSITVSDGAVLEIDPSAIPGMGLSQFFCIVGGS